MQRKSRKGKQHCKNEEVTRESRQEMRQSKKNFSKGVRNMKKKSSWEGCVFQAVVLCCTVVFARSLQNKSCPSNITHTRIHTGKTNMAQVSPQKQRGQEAGSLLYTQRHPVHLVLLHKLPHPPLCPDLLSIFVRRNVQWLGTQAFRKLPFIIQ